MNKILLEETPQGILCTNIQGNEIRLVEMMIAAMSADEKFGAVVMSATELYLEMKLKQKMA